MLKAASIGAILFFALVVLSATPALAQETITDTVTATAEPITDTATPTAQEPMTETITPVAQESVTGTMPVTLTTAMDGRVIYHDAFSTRTEFIEGITTSVGMYQAGDLPWLDLLVQFEDGQWYGPERQDDDIDAQPLPDGYMWQVTGTDFGTLPSGAAWWDGLGTAGQADLVGPDGTVLQRLFLRVEIHS